MRLVIVSLTRDVQTDGRPLAQAALIDILWSLAEPSDRIEHISAVAYFHEAHVGLYIQADSEADARQRARALLERATAISGLLHCWSVPAQPGCPAP